MSHQLRWGVRAADLSRPVTFRDDQGIEWRGNLVADARHHDYADLRLVRTEHERYFWVTFGRLTIAEVKSDGQP